MKFLVDGTSGSVKDGFMPNFKSEIALGLTNMASSHKKMKIFSRRNFRFHQNQISFTGDLVIGDLVIHRIFITILIINNIITT